MRNKIFAALLCAVMLAFCACGDKSGIDIPEGFQLASDDAAYYYFFVPTGWTVDITSTATSAYVSSSDPSSVSVMSWSSGVSDMTPEEWWDSFIPDFEKVYDEFTVESEENMLLDGEAARSVVFTATLGDVKYKFRQIAAVHESVVYVMTYTSTEDFFELHTEDVGKMAEYFEFK